MNPITDTQVSASSPSGIAPLLFPNSQVFVRGQGLPCHRNSSFLCPQRTSREMKKTWGCCSKSKRCLTDLVAPSLLSGSTGHSSGIKCASDASSAADPDLVPLPRSWDQYPQAATAVPSCPQTLGCRGRMSPPSVAPWQVLGVVPAFLTAGNAAQSRFGNRELSCLPPAPLTAQTGPCFTAAEAIAQPPLMHYPSVFPQGKLAPVQSRQEGLAAL